MKRPSEDKKMIGVKIDSALWKRFKIFALQKDTTATKLLEEAMREYLRKHEKK
jgi:hypothetical protein